MVSSVLILGLILTTSIITGLIVKAVKKLLDKKSISYSSNIVAGITSLPATIFVVYMYYAFFGIPEGITIPMCIVCVIIVYAFSWYASMAGYDKASQTFKQLIDAGLFSSIFKKSEEDKDNANGDSNSESGEDDDAGLK